MSTPDFRALVTATLAGRSVSWLSRESGVPQPTLSEWLSGRNKGINSPNLEKVLAALGLFVVGPKKSRKIPVDTLSEKR